MLLSQSGLGLDLHKKEREKRKISNFAISRRFHSLLVQIQPTLAQFGFYRHQQQQQHQQEQQHSGNIVKI